MSLILVGIHIDKSVEEVSEEIELYGRSKYFKSNLLKVFDTDNMMVYDLSFKDIVKYNYSIELFNRTNSDIGDFVEINDLGCSSSYPEMPVLAFEFPLICNNGLAGKVRFVGFYTNIENFSLYADAVTSNILLVCGNKTLPFNEDEVKIDSGNSIIFSTFAKEVSCYKLVMPINSYSYNIYFNNTIYIDLDSCNDDLIVIPKEKDNILVYWSNHRDMSIVVPVGINGFFLNGLSLNYYDYCIYTGTEFSEFDSSGYDISYITFIVSKTDTKFLELMISELYRYMNNYKSIMSLDTSRFSDKDYVIDKLKDLFSILIEFY